MLSARAWPLSHHAGGRLSMSLRARHVAEGLGAGHEWSRVVRTERRRWHDRAYRGRVWFDEEVRRRHKRFRQSIPAFLRDGTLGNLLTTPVIYSLALPFLLLDLWVSAYQAICFPIYGIAGSCVAARTSRSTATSSPISMG